MKTFKACDVPLGLSLIASSCAVSVSAATASPLVSPVMTSAISSTIAAKAPASQDQQRHHVTALDAHTLAFLRAFMPWCGQSVTGTIVVDNAKDPRFDGKDLRLQIADCHALTSAVSQASLKPSAEPLLRMPFQVGTDKSRTWLFSLTAQGLHFQHQHLHADGQPDTVSMYGGYLAQVEVLPSLQVRYDFPADEFSKSMFTKHNMAVSNANTWQIVLQYDAHQRLIAMQYQLVRPGRQFVVRFEFTPPTSA